MQFRSAQQQCSPVSHSKHSRKAVYAERNRKTKYGQDTVMLWAYFFYWWLSNDSKSLNARKADQILPGNFAAEQLHVRQKQAIETWDIVQRVGEWGPERNKRYQTPKKIPQRKEDPSMFVITVGLVEVSIYTRIGTLQRPDTVCCEGCH